MVQRVTECITIKSTPRLINIKPKDLTKFGIKAPLFTLLPSVYPEHEWLPWKFRRHTPTGFWNDQSNQRKFVEWAATELQVKEMDDWYNITYRVKKN